MSLKKTKLFAAVLQNDTSGTAGGHHLSVPSKNIQITLTNINPFPDLTRATKSNQLIESFTHKLFISSKTFEHWIQVLKIENLLLTLL